MLKWRHNGLRKKLEPCVIMAEGANTTLLLAWLFETDIQQSLIQCWYTSLPTSLWWTEHAKTTAEIKRSPGLGWWKHSHCFIIQGKIETCIYRYTNDPSSGLHYNYTGIVDRQVYIHLSRMLDGVWTQPATASCMQYLMHNPEMSMPLY